MILDSMTLDNLSFPILWPTTTSVCAWQQTKYNRSSRRQWRGENISLSRA